MDREKSREGGRLGLQSLRLIRRPVLLHAPASPSARSGGERRAAIRVPQSTLFQKAHAPPLLTRPQRARLRSFVTREQGRDMELGDLKSQIFFFEIEISRLLRLKKVLTRTNILLRTVTFKYVYELKFREIGTGVPLSFL